MKQIKKGNCPQPGCRSLSVFISDKHGVHRKAKKKPKLSQKSMTLTKGKSKTLKVKNTKKMQGHLENKQEKKIVSISKKETYLLQIKGKERKRNRKNHLHGKKKEKTYKLTCKVKVKAKKPSLLPA